MDTYKNILEMHGISKKFPGVQALDKVDLDIRAGEVHALMGENGAGKSTLMKVLFGIYRKDEGEILFDGKPIEIENPNDALQTGIAMVQQELEQVPKRTVMDNIWLGRLPKKGLFVDDKAMYQKTSEIIKSFGMKIDPNSIVGDLSVSTKQMVDIVKAVSYNAKLIVFDEPTSSLTEIETNALFSIIQRLKNEGVGIIYISHKMDEILKISDRVTVMRDGCKVATKNISEIDQNTLIKLMVNREMKSRFPERDNIPGETILKVENLCSVYHPHLKDVSFEVKKGELFGIGGLVGAGRTELLECLFGLRSIKSGKIFINGEDIVKGGKHAKQTCMGCVTEERRVTGIFPLMDIRWNTVIASLKKNLNRYGFLSMKKVEEHTQEMIKAMRTKTPSTSTLISSLSGGNQQKVLLGRCLEKKPDILLLDEPTRGIDVGAKQEIYQLMIGLAKEGKTVIFVSSEMPELLGVADRILVMSNGHSAGVVSAKDTTQEEIMKLSTMYL